MAPLARRVRRSTPQGDAGRLGRGPALGLPSQPPRLAKAPIHRAADATDDGKGHRVAVGPLQLGHVLKVHAPNADEEGGHSKDGKDAAF